MPRVTEKLETLHTGSATTYFVLDDITSILVLTNRIFPKASGWCDITNLCVKVV